MNQPEVSIDDTDRAILNRIQSDFPITSRPYRTIAEELGLPENEVLKRILRLKESGIIRRIGGNFMPEKLGFVALTDPLVGFITKATAVPTAANKVASTLLAA